MIKSGHLIKPLDNYDVPAGWPSKPYKRPYGGTPGAPVMYQKPSDPDETGAGYGYSNAEGLSENDVYFYHSDHLGSTSYITDRDGNVSQYIAYKPFGETLIDEHAVSYDSPWKFNRKEWDSETGLYYYGARYYEPGLSLWYGVDALAEKYPAMGGYVYCVGNPVKFVDTDGQRVRIFMTKVSLTLGLFAGISGSAYIGTAYDDYGVTHFTGTGNMLSVADQNCLLGADLNIGVEYSVDFHFCSLYDYLENSFSTSAPIELYDFVGLGVGYSAHTEDKIDGAIVNVGIGMGFSVGFGYGNSILHESISVSNDEANVINYGSIIGRKWNVNNIHLNEDNKTFSGYVNGVIKVITNAIIQNGKLTPSNIWKSEGYIKNETGNGN